MNKLLALSFALIYSQCLFALELAWKPSYNENTGEGTYLLKRELQDCRKSLDFNLYKNEALDWCNKLNLKLIPSSYGATYTTLAKCDIKYSFICDLANKVEIEKIRTYKDQCVDLGYKKGTKKFSNCVTEMMK